MCPHSLSLHRRQIVQQRRGGFKALVISLHHYCHVNLATPLLHVNYVSQKDDITHIDDHLPLFRFWHHWISIFGKMESPIPIWIKTGKHILRAPSMMRNILRDIIYQFSYLDNQGNHDYWRYTFNHIGIFFATCARLD